MPDIRIYKGSAIYWQGEGTYYFLKGNNIWCRVQCVETLDFEMQRQTSLVYIKEAELTN